MNVFKVLQLNVYSRPKFIKTHGRDYRTYRLTTLLKIAPEYDVLCLQEFFQCRRNAAMNNRFLGRLRMMGFQYIIGGPYRGCAPVMGGLLLASKFPILEYDSVPFCEHGYGADALSAKGFLYARIQFQGKCVQFITTHLQAMYGLNEEEKHKAVVSAQLAQITEFIKTQIRQDEGIILCGDFNVDGIAGAREEMHADAGGLKRLTAIYNADEGAYQGTLTHPQMPGLGAKCSSRYEEMMEALNCLEDIRRPAQGAVDGASFKIVDVIRQTYQGLPPVTFADVQIQSGRVEPREKQLTSDPSYCSAQRLDYVFTYDNGQLTTISGRVKTGFTQHGVVQQLSDHYGSEVEFAL